MISSFLDHLWSGAALAAAAMASAPGVDSKVGENSPGTPGAFNIEPTFEEMPEFTVAGIAAYATPMSNQFPALWHHFQGARNGAGGLDNSIYAFGLELFPPDPSDQHHFTYMACNPVSDPEAVPVYLLKHTLPAARYAVFRVPGGVAGLSQAFPFIYQIWLPQSGFVRAHPFDFERYDLRVPAPTVNDIPLDIVVPISPKLVV